MDNPLKLKKYANRRLYDTETSTFLSLTQVADLVKQGREIEVVDAKTGEDVTNFILAQIVMEEVKNKTLLLPLSLLYMLIRYGDSVLSDFFDSYLEQTLKNYLSYKSAMDEQFRKWLEVGQNFSSVTENVLETLNPFNPWMASFSETSKAGDSNKEEEES
jgi:polyhydroxyalkanoate synthesis repressor PhaR